MQEFCEEIIGIMLKEFGISREEAIARINSQWGHLDTLYESNSSAILHDTSDFWAYEIYYGGSSYWWKRLDDPTLKPKPISLNEQSIVSYS